MSDAGRNDEPCRISVTAGRSGTLTRLGNDVYLDFTMLPQFLYFDLGKVLIDFSVERMLRQMGDVAGIASQRVHEAIFGGRLLLQHETGKIGSREFYEAFCDATKTRPDYQRLTAAVSDIFEINRPMLPLVAHLGHAGYPMGILSNTCEIHWEYCLARYRILSECFGVHALSYRIGAVKPEPAIFRAAAELAGCRPEAIFFADDIAGHVAGARAVGFDAVQFTTAAALADELRRRGVRFNY
jgi:glucose-1-phosphatase